MAFEMELCSKQNGRIGMLASFAHQFSCVDFIHHCFAIHEESLICLERIFTEVSIQ